MHYAVIDEEFCRVPYKTVLAGGYSLKNEIIQIGIVILNEDYCEETRFCEFVNPQYGVIDPYINRLTGISQKMVSEGESLADIWERIINILPEDSVMVSWSMSDRKQLEEELKEKGILKVSNRIFENWFDCQKRFADIIGTTKQYCLSDALNMSAIIAEGSNHNALDDALNTASLFRAINAPDFKVTECYISASADTVPLSFSLGTLFTNLIIA